MLKRKRVIFFDYDNTLGRTEELSFSACLQAVNELLRAKGIDKQFTVAELMRNYVGASFSTILEDLCRIYGFSMEKSESTEFLKQLLDRIIAVLEANLEPTDGVNELLSQLSQRFEITIVSNSGLRRLTACLKKANQARFFSEDRIFSARDSLARPAPKPAPDILFHAMRCRRVAADECVLADDSVSGVLAGVGAGVDVIGYTGCYSESEQSVQAVKLPAAGARAVIRHWSEFIPALSSLEGRVA